MACIHLLHHDQHVCNSYPLSLRVLSLSMFCSAVLCPAVFLCFAAFLRVVLITSAVTFILSSLHVLSSALSSFASSCIVTNLTKYFCFFSVLFRFSFSLIHSLFFRWWFQCSPLSSFLVIAIPSSTPSPFPIVSATAVPSFSSFSLSFSFLYFSSSFPLSSFSVFPLNYPSTLLQSVQAGHSCLLV